MYHHWCSVSCVQATNGASEISVAGPVASHRVVRQLPMYTMAGCIRHTWSRKCVTSGTKKNIVRKVKQKHPKQNISTDDADNVRRLCQWRHHRNALPPVVFFAVATGHSHKALRRDVFGVSASKLLWPASRRVPVDVSASRFCGLLRPDRWCLMEEARASLSRVEYSLPEERRHHALKYNLNLHTWYVIHDCRRRWNNNQRPEALCP